MENCCQSIYSARTRLGTIETFRKNHRSFVKLQTSQFVTAASLASEFDVSERTIYRDIRAMEAAGIPMYTEAGKGIQLMHGFRLPPTSFTENEINALVTAELLVSKNPDSSLIKNYGDALDKIMAIIRYQEQEKASLLDRRISFSKNGESKTHIGSLRFNHQ